MSNWDKDWPAWDIEQQLPDDYCSTYYNPYAVENFCSWLLGWSDRQGWTLDSDGNVIDD